MQHTFTMNERKAHLVFQVVDDHCKALKNWIASAVESNEIERARQLVEELRDYQALYAAFNMQAKHDIADETKKEVETNHTVR